MMTSWVIEIDNPHALWSFVEFPAHFGFIVFSHHHRAKALKPPTGSQENIKTKTDSAISHTKKSPCSNHSNGNEYIDMVEHRVWCHDSWGRYRDIVSSVASLYIVINTQTVTNYCLQGQPARIFVFWGWWCYIFWPYTCVVLLQVDWMLSRPQLLSGEKTLTGGRALFFGPYQLYMVTMWRENFKMFCMVSLPQSGLIYSSYPSIISQQKRPPFHW